MTRRPPRSPLFPTPPLSRSHPADRALVDPPQQRRGAALVHTRALHEALPAAERSEEHTSELQSQSNLVCRLLLEKKKKNVLDLSLSPSLIACQTACVSAALA